MKLGLKLRGRYDITIIGCNGKVRKRLTAHNDIVAQGVEHLLNVFFHTSAKSVPWFISLIDDASFGGLANTDTAAAHAGWTENTDYDEATRVAWDEATAVNEGMTSDTPSSFTMNANVVIRGAALSSVNGKASAAGVLFSTAEFDEGPETVESGEILNVEYTIVR